MSAESTTQEFRYAAFVSYRHALLDRRWAVWLHTALETYRVPQRLVAEGTPARVGRVFRDEEELAAAADLSETIETALRQSKFLIVICSPRCANSAWVNREVEFFRELGRADQILSLLIEGEPAEAFPPALCALRQAATPVAFPAKLSPRIREPLAADGRPRQGERTAAIKRTVLLRLIATIVGVNFDDLRQREHERVLRRMIRLSAAALALLSIVSLLALFAWVQRNFAVNVAASNKQLAADKGDLLAEERRQAEIRLVRTGMELVDSGDAFSALPWLAAGMLKAEPEREEMHRIRLASVMHQTPVLKAMLFFDRSVSDVAFSPDATRFVVVSGEARMYDIASPDRPRFSVTLPGGLSGANFSPSGTSFVTWSNSLVKDHGGNRLWDAATGASLSAHLNVGRPISWARVSPDSLQIAARGNAPENFYGLVVNEVGTGASVTSPVAGERDVSYLQWSLDGQSVFTAGHEKKGDVYSNYSRLWRKQGETFQVVYDSEQSVDYAIFSRSGRRVALRHEAGTALVLDCATGQAQGPVITHPRKIISLDLDREGDQLLTVNEDNRAFADTEAERLNGEAVVWNVATGKPLLRPLRHEGEDVKSAKFSAEAELILTRSATQARLWRSGTGAPLTPPIRHRGGLYAASISSDVRYLLTAGAEGTVRLWDLTHPACVHLSPETGLGRHIGSRAARFVAPGSGMVVNSFWTTRTFSPDTLRPLTPPLLSPTDIFGLSPDGQCLAIAEHKNDFASACQIHVVEPLTGKRVAGPWPYPSGIKLLAFDAAGKRLLVGGMAGQFQVWDVPADKPITSLEPAGGEIAAGSLNASGTIAAVAAGTRDGLGQLTIWRIDQGVQQASAKLDGVTSAVIFANQDREVIVAGGSPWGSGGDNVGSRGIVTRFDSATGQPIGEPYTQPGYISSASLQPGGQLLALACKDRTVKLLDRQTLVPAAAQLQHDVGVNSLFWSNDGKLFLSAAGDPAPSWRPGQARVWEAATGLPISPWLPHALEVNDAAFSPDLGRLVTCGHDVLKIWQLGRRSESREGLIDLCGILSEARVDPILGLTPLSSKELRQGWDSLAVPATKSSRDEPLSFWHRSEALLAEQSGQWRVARRHLDPLIEENPGDQGLVLRRATVLSKLEAWTEAEADFTTFLADGENGPARRGRGLVRQALKNWPGTIEDFTAALANTKWLAYEEIGETLTERGWTYAESGDLDQAYADFGQALEPIQQLTPDAHWRALYGRGRIEMSRENFDEAEADFAQALEWAESVAAPRMLTTLRYYRAVALVGQGQIEDGLKELKIVEQRGWNRSQVLRLRAGALLKLSKHAEALPVLREAQQIDPKDGELVVLEAETQAELNQFAEAAQRYSKAVELGEKEAATRADWLLTTLAVGDREAAKNIAHDLEKHLSLLKEIDDLALVLESLTLQPGNAPLPQAVEIAERLLRDESDELWIKRVAAGVLVRAGLMEKATTILLPLVAQQVDLPSRLEAGLWLSLLLASQGEAEAAMREFAKCTAILDQPIPEDWDCDWRDRTRWKLLRAEAVKALVNLRGL